MSTELAEAHIPDLPPEAALNLLSKGVDQFARITRPKFYGLDNITDERVFFVGNHTVYGLLDVGFMLQGLYKHKGIVVRSLGDFKHWSIPGWGQIATATGGVPGTPANLTELMRRGDPVLVFPGGAREANKRRGEKYQLIWKERIGFAKLAIENDYPIIPFAGVGAEEMYDIVLDDSNRVHRLASSGFRRVTGMPIPSIVRGIGPTMIPRPTRLYFWFGKPIDSSQFRRDDFEAGARELRDVVRDEVAGGIKFLREERRLEISGG
jgi:1-acyl-sn-glycerol-3-phosphate acyltransferase